LTIRWRPDLMCKAPRARGSEIWNDDFRQNRSLNLAYALKGESRQAKAIPALMRNSCSRADISGLFSLDEERTGDLALTPRKQRKQLQRFPNHFPSRLELLHIAVYICRRNRCEETNKTRSAARDSRPPDSAGRRLGLRSWLRNRAENPADVARGAPGSAGIALSCIAPPAVQEISCRGLGPSETGRDAKFCRLTARGRRQLETEAASWPRLTEVVGLILQGPQEEAS